MNTTNDQTSHADTITWTTETGTHVAPAERALLAQEIYLAKQIRTGSHYQRQRNYHGLYFFESTAEHIWHESLFERDALRLLDFREDIVAINAQPFRIDWAAGGAHFPDFMAIHANSEQIVYDVRPADRIDDDTQRQFDKTRDTCAQIGWGYEVISLLPLVLRSNLEYLSHFRSHRFRPAKDIRRRLEQLLPEGPTVNDVVSSFDATDRTQAVAGLMHMCWTREAQCSLTELISLQTIVWSAA